MNGETGAIVTEVSLAGRRIVVTRAREQAGSLVTRLLALGAEPVECPAISIAPLPDFTELDTAVASIETYDWVIFTSVNGVKAFSSRMASLGKDRSLLCGRRLAAIGPATKKALEELGCTTDFMPTSYVAEAIVEQIGDVEGCRVLLPRADIARDALGNGLRDRGATVTEVDAYRTKGGEGGSVLARMLQAGSIDAITFTSSSTVRYTFLSLIESGLSETAARELLNSTSVVCIGPITAGTAQELGLKITAVADEYTTGGLVRTLLRLFGARGPLG